MKKALIIGVSGQDGAYLAELLLAKGYEVYGTSRDHEASSFRNLDRLGLREKVRLCSMATSDFRSVLSTLQKVEPDEIYNLAGQTSVGMSFNYPVETFESIMTATLNILECLRLFPKPIRFYNAGSSECFGNTETPATESAPFHPRSPYATAKAAAHYAVQNYREAYGLFACTGILFNHESPLRPARFVTRKIVSGAVKIATGKQDKLVLGNLDVERDWGWAPEYVDAMWRILQIDEPQDFVIATGAMNSLRLFVENVFRHVGLDAWSHVETSGDFFRPSDIIRSVGDPSKAHRLLGWKSETDFPTLAAKLVEAERSAS